MKSGKKNRLATGRIMVSFAVAMEFMLRVNIISGKYN